MTTSRLNSIERKIWFFRAHPTTPATSWRWDPVHIASQIEAVPFMGGGATRRGQRLMRMDGDRTATALIDDTSGNPHIRFGHARKNALPEILDESSGDTSGLNITNDQSLFEQSHIVLFQNGIIGVVFNWYGPRPHQFATFSDWILQDEDHHFFMGRLVDPDVAQRLDDLVSIHDIDLNIDVPYATRLDQLAPGIGGALQAAYESQAGQSVRLRLHADARSDKSLPQRFMGGVRDLFGSGEADHFMKSFSVDGYDRNGELISGLNLLNQYLVVHQRVVLQDAQHRILDPNSAYDAIESTYVEYQDQIDAAADIS